MTKYYLKVGDQSGAILVDDFFDSKEEVMDAIEQAKEDCFDDPDTLEWEWFPASPCKECKGSGYVVKPKSI